MKKKSTHSTGATATEAAPVTPTTATGSSSHERIAERARSLWQSYGQPEGRDQEIWLEAERAIDAENPPAATSRRQQH